MKSIFVNKAVVPTEENVLSALGNTYDLWQTLVLFVKKSSPQVFEEWNFSGEKFGWSFRIKDKKRVVVYFLPRDKFFKVAFVFGQKATDLILKSTISDSIKTELKSAKVYAEGRGIRIEIRDQNQLDDIKHLIEIKIAN
ncbi:MAG TPA: DUF3788 domain-containing protein [Bacteroidia bacterium]|nr:DUF3788 domain-containing protein [Bacteroidia bacterium]